MNIILQLVTKTGTTKHYRASLPTLTFVGKANFESAVTASKAAVIFPVTPRDLLTPKRGPRSKSLALPVASPPLDPHHS